MHKNYPQVFGKEWFEKYQVFLLWLANTRYGRDILHINGNRSLVGKNRIIKIEPHAITWTPDGKVLQTEFRTHNKFGKRLFYSYKEFWKMLHWFDMHFANKYCPRMNLGFDTLTVYPEAGAGGVNVTCDGYVYRGEVDETFSTIRDGAGSGSSDTSVSVVACYIKGSSTSNQWSYLMRGVFSFNTSSLGSNAIISAATLSLYFYGKNNNVGDIDCHIAEAHPTDPADLAAGDYSNISRTSFASKSYSDVTINQYTDFNLNSSGKNNINKTGVSSFSTQSQWDINNNTTGLTWSSGAYSRFIGYPADYDGTDKDPKLVITYQEGAPFVPKVMFIG